MCISIAWFFQMLIVLVLLCGIVALLRLWVFPMLSSVDPRVPQTIHIIMWVIVAIFIIYVCASLLECAFIGGFSLMPRR